MRHEPTQLFTTALCHSCHLPFPPVSAAHSDPGLAVPKAAEDHVGPSVGFVSHRLSQQDRESQRSFTLQAVKPAELCCRSAELYREDPRSVGSLQQGSTGAQSHAHPGRKVYILHMQLCFTPQRIDTDLRTAAKSKPMRSFRCWELGQRSDDSALPDNLFYVICLQ